MPPASAPTRADCPHAVALHADASSAAILQAAAERIADADRDLSGEGDG